MKKKFISLLLVMILIISIAVPAYAKDEPNSLTQEIITLIDVDESDAKSTLDMYGIDVKEIYAKEELYGDVEYIKITVDTKKEELSESLDESKSTVSKRMVYVETQYNDDWEQVNASPYGLSYWLDVTYNLVIGTKTEDFWKLSTILGLNPSCQPPFSTTPMGVG